MASTFDTGGESLDTASDLTVGLSERCLVALRFVSERDLPLGRTVGGVGVAVGAPLDRFDVVRSGMSAGVVSVAWAPPVLTATPEGADVVFEPVDVEVMVDVDIEGSADVFGGVEDAADPGVPVFVLAVDGLVDGS